TERNSKVRNGKEVYTYRSFGLPYELKDQIYPKTVTAVHHPDDINATLIDQRFEVYAEEVGLVHKVYKMINLKQNLDDDSYTIINGHERHEILIEHGKL